MKRLWRAAEWRAILEFCLSVVRRFREERATQTAGSLSYTTLLSLVPLLTVALAIASAFPVFDDAVQALREFVIRNFLPEARGFHSVVAMLDAFSKNVGKLTAMGVIGFMLSGVLLMMTIDNALNRIFRVQRGRSILQRMFVYWAVLTLGPVLIGVSLSGTYFAVSASLGKLDLGLTADTVVRVLPFLFTCATLALLYAIVPFRQVRLRHAVTGAILAGIAFEFAKRGFALYLGRVPTYRLIYGAFATIPIFLVWLYVSWVVVLAGAVFTAMLPGYGMGHERNRPPGREVVDALAILSMLARAHAEGGALDMKQLARRVRLLPYQCERVLERTAALGWTARTDRDAWVLARDSDALSVGEVYREFLFGSEGGALRDEDFGLSLREYSEKDRA